MPRRQRTNSVFRALLWIGLACAFGVCLLTRIQGSQADTSPAADTSQAGRAALPGAQLSIVVFTKTAGFRHDSIAAGIAAIRMRGQAHGFQVDATEDATIFSKDRLALYRVVVFLNTTGDILDASQQAALEQFVQQGGGFVGIHSATDTEYDWPWYGQLVGAYFADHPALQSATVQVLDSTHPSMQSLPTRWTRTDEWYNFRALPGPGVTILAEIDESTYTGGTMGLHHPLVWCHEYDGGRAWYTAMGHTSASYADSLFLDHLLGGILWASGGTDTTDMQNHRYLPMLMNPQA